MVAMGYVTTLPGDLHQDKLTMCSIKCTTDNFYCDVHLSETEYKKNKKTVVSICRLLIGWRQNAILHMVWKKAVVFSRLMSRDSSYPFLIKNYGKN